MSEISPVSGQIPFPQSGSPQANFVLRLSQLNQEFRQTLGDYDAGSVSFTQVHAAAYNVYCFVQDNHTWLQSGEHQSLEEVTSLLYPHNTKDETKAIGNFTSASDTIQSNITNPFFQNGG